MIHEFEHVAGEGNRLEVRQDRIQARERWAVRAAQWRTLALARAVFGDAVRIALAPYPPRGPFRGLVHLRVPFDDVESHRAREARFAQMAAEDEVLQRVPLVFAFEPDPRGRTRA